MKVLKCAAYIAMGLTGAAWLIYNLALYPVFLGSIDKTMTNVADRGMLESGLAFLAPALVFVFSAMLPGVAGILAGTALLIKELGNVEQSETQRETPGQGET